MKNQPNCFLFVLLLVDNVENWRKMAIKDFLPFELIKRTLDNTLNRKKYGPHCTRRYFGHDFQYLMQSGF